MSINIPSTILKNIALNEAYTTAGNDGSSFLFVDSSITYGALNLITELKNVPPSEPILVEDGNNFVY
jgi:hypothetical protein